MRCRDHLRAILLRRPKKRIPNCNPAQFTAAGSSRSPGPFAFSQLDFVTSSESETPLEFVIIRLLAQVSVEISSDMEDTIILNSVKRTHVDSSEFVARGESQN